MGKWSYEFRYPGRITQCCFFYYGKSFYLRGGAEHRNLKVSQIRKEITVVDGKTVMFMRNSGRKTIKVALLP